MKTKNIIRKIKELRKSIKDREAFKDVMGHKEYYIKAMEGDRYMLDLYEKMLESSI